MAFDAAGALELGQERQQWVAPVELVRAVGEQEHHRRIAKVSHEESEQVARRAIRPMEVLDDEYDWRPGGQPLQEPQEQFEQPTLSGAEAEARGRFLGHWTEIRDEPRELGAAEAQDGLQFLRLGAPDEPAQRLDHRRERESAIAENDAAALENDRALAPGQVGERCHQPRLADPSLAGDQGRAAPAGVREVECGTKSLELM